MFSPKEISPIRDTSHRYPPERSNKPDEEDYKLQGTSELLHLMPLRVGSSPKMMTP